MSYDISINASILDRVNIDAIFLIVKILYHNYYKTFICIQIKIIFKRVRWCDINEWLNLSYVCPVSSYVSCEPQTLISHTYINSE